MKLVSVISNYNRCCSEKAMSFNEQNELIKTNITNNTKNIAFSKWLRLFLTRLKAFLFKSKLWISRGKQAHKHVYVPWLVFLLILPHFFLMIFSPFIRMILSIGEWFNQNAQLLSCPLTHLLCPLSVCLSFFVTFTLIDKICCTVSLHRLYGICSFHLLVPNSLSISKIFSMFVLSNLFSIFIKRHQTTPNYL